ncbi:MAG: signal recognition particle subunit SRP19/SEC65 family protein [Nitrososphaerales archaeon]
MTLKSYDRLVVWLDYLDSERKRSEGRRVPMNSCSRAPTLDELTLACSRLGLQPEAQVARFPGAASRASGYVSIKKTAKKQPTVIQIARELSKVKGEKAAGQGKLKGKS